MGLLKDFGGVLSYQQSKSMQETLQLMAAEQFIHIFQMYHFWHKSTSSCEIAWGDEIEGHRFCYDAKTNKMTLALKPLPVKQHPYQLEYGMWMFESVPENPFRTKCDFKTIVSAIRNRYMDFAEDTDIFMTIPSVPFMGAITQQESRASTFENSITQSRFIHDKHISDHIRFRTLTKNIRERRGRTVDIKVPIFKDKNTNLTESSYMEPYPGYIYMDAMAFGMGMCCLQCTFSTKDINHARYLYDNLHVISPMFLALTAGTPILKGKLSDWDVRWNIICDSVDDRTQEEMNPKSKNYQPKSRYSSASSYLSNSDLCKPQYNDIPVRINEKAVQHIRKTLKEKDLEMDEPLIRHLGILLSREFMVVHQKFEEMDSSSHYLFEMINSTNWNSVRFKIPIDDSIGWRVEFRTMEIQLTADENSAYNILVFIMVMMMHHISNLNFYIPLSMVEENFHRAHQRNAITQQRFFFRTNIKGAEEAVIQELTLYEIFFGSTTYQFLGLLPIFQEFFEHPLLCPRKKEGLNSTFQIINSLTKFLKMKMSGQIMTLAQWIRRFVETHKDYKSDSVVSESISTDLILTLNKITKGEIQDDTFHTEIFQI